MENVHGPFHHILQLNKLLESEKYWYDEWSLIIHKALYWYYPWFT